MSRARSRVQGAGWASQGVGPRSDRNKPKLSVQPEWQMHTVDQHKKGQRDYTFSDQDISKKQQRLEKIIDKQGVYDLSHEPSGSSRVRLFPHFLSPSDASSAFDELFREISWQQKTNHRPDGKSYLEPRLTAWFSEFDYKYSGILQKANNEWPALLLELKRRLEETTGQVYNSVLCNLYRDNHDTVSWHTDAEFPLGDEPVIASISLGDTRMFELRKVPPEPTEGGERDFSESQLVKIPLTSGSLLIMEGATQADWQHRVPREYHDRSRRINLTFRYMHTDRLLV